MMTDSSPLNAFVDRFGAALTEAGMPRMAARVLALLLSLDSGGATAAEIAARLQGSAGAVSGAVRYLIQVDLVDREHLSGSRRDFYRIRPDVWYDATARQDARYARWHTLIGQGIDAVGAETPAGRRLAETQSFFAFLQLELPALVERWRAREDVARGRQS